MDNRKLYLLAVGVGGTLGAFVPGLWGASDLSGWAVLTSALGSLACLWLARRIAT